MTTSGGVSDVVPWFSDEEEEARADAAVDRCLAALDPARVSELLAGDSEASRDGPVDLRVSERREADGVSAGPSVSGE